VSGYNILSLEYFTLSIMGLLLVLDNLRITICLGTLNINKSCRKRLAISFGVFETLTPILGFVIGNSVAQIIEYWAGYVGPFAAAAYGIYIISLSRNEEKLDRITNQIWLILGLPFSLSLDNLMAGIGLGLIGFQIVPFAIIVGVCSCFVSLAGLKLGGTVRKFLYNKSQAVAGVILIAASTSLVIMQFQ
jgi:putative Mn2+ efflux pump MntP